MAEHYELRLQKEAKVKEYLTLGLSTRDIAKRLEISQQSAQRYLARRGWKTAASLAEGDLAAMVAKHVADGLDVEAIAHRVGRTPAVVRTAMRN